MPDGPGRCIPDDPPGATDADILTRIGNHSFHATVITEYLRNGGKLEVAQQMAAHESVRTTGSMTGVTTKYPWMRLSGS
ncbi:hypothetical protein [Nitrosovibrio sp. Nv4]|uniref:hypothetical protein n=1 Tax=Nitrosovibrio sp. Nv4 TaxID=1945880 RepID=UPI0015E7690C|nr:hypothetical protein [Nitrosovibrio sp. Nv4]